MFQVVLKEKAGLARKDALVQFGIPFPKSLFFNHRELVAKTEDGSVLPTSASTTMLWPDNSIKWCLVNTEVNIDANKTIKLKIDVDTDKFKSSQCPSDFIQETDSVIIVKTKHHVFEINKKRFCLLDKATNQGEIIADRGFCTLDTRDHGKLQADVNTYRYYMSSTSECPLSSIVELHGTFRSPGGDNTANFTATLTFHIKTDRLKCDITLHNPKPAIHTSGQWDLGDANSLFFSAFDLGIAVNDIQQTNWKPESNMSWSPFTGKSLCIYQESSGGDNWDSPNHKNRHNRVPYTLKGYECRDTESVICTGERATPGASLRTQSGNIGIYIENFWQNCPKSLCIEDNTVSIGLFPTLFSDGFELQPGERKTHSFYLAFNNDPESVIQLDNPLEVSLQPAWLEKTGVFQNFTIDTANDAIFSIIAEGLYGKDNFYTKREAIDEYGWRNFGDLYADHETEGYEGTELFISHYNNQYDPLYGFLRQFALTADIKWLELANDLANHVTDIDIYHSWGDKSEYNGGLFWHTDHYLDAETSTHRSFSKHQKSNAYIDHAGGGGPGGQHCYTTGLLYHYLLTGNDASRDAVIQLADWVERVYEGSGTLLGTLLSLKNRNRPGEKNIVTGQYPLDRGTGNYINALLDKFSLTQQPAVLHQVEHIIQNTVHPLDDISTRELDNVELCWFYTVFLQSLCRYLQIKEELSTFDDSFYYARDSLLHYADWMLDNEYPYLEKPEILEFPNHTWTAQDLRKVNILLLADYYSSGKKTVYAEKSNQLYSYITGTLPHDNTRTSTRILAILMQNHGAKNYFDRPHMKPDFEERRSYPPVKNHGLYQAARNVSSALVAAIWNISPKNELLWLSHRSGLIAKLTRIRP